LKADPKGVLTGEHYLDGDHACSEGAIAAGCRFLAGYPITPSTEVAERISERFPEVGGIFIQMEDEMGSMAAVVGAAWGGVKALTVTSGPGFSLMMENIGLAAMLETPCVVINVQRGGPSTGLPTLPGQADMMQARWGSHGDYEIIAVSPNSPQECFEMVIKAVNLSEKYRVPVMVMTDECVGHMTEKVVIPPADQIELYPRRYTKLPPDQYLPFKAGKDMIPDMVKAGDGYKIHVTGLTHDEKGYPVMSWQTQEKLVRRLVEKIRLHADELEDIEEMQMGDAEVVIFSYGISSRVCIPALQKARKEGMKVGLLRPIICWPFPEKKIKELAGKVKAFVVVEMNYGQMYFEVERCVCGKAKTLLVPHGGGWVHDPEDILKAIKEAVK
jgi:2-oxoglutarate ferredoxin oxidoreductase subunit alpha